MGLQRGSNHVIDTAKNKGGAARVHECQLRSQRLRHANVFQSGKRDAMEPMQKSPTIGLVRTGNLACLIEQTAEQMVNDNAE